MIFSNFQRSTLPNSFRNSMDFDRMKNDIKNISKVGYTTMVHTKQKHPFQKDINQFRLGRSEYNDWSYDVL